jgi:rubrerythrin
MAFKSVDDVLAFAIEREEAAARTYHNLAGRAQAEPGRAFLKELEGEERNHKKLLSDLRAGRAVVLKAGSVADLGLTDGLVDEPLDETSSFQDILIAAAKKEAQAIELYERLAGEAADPAHRELFEFLVGQEKRHKLRLEREYEARVLTEF